MLQMLDGPPTEQGWYWCCEAYSPYAMYVVWVFEHGGHNDHEMTFEEAAEIEAQWWGPIQAPKDPEYYGKNQPRASAKECKHGMPLAWPCNACSDSGDDPRKPRRYTGLG